MILTAASISVLQSCPRRLLLEADYEVIRWRPKLLMDAMLRKGILEISQGANASSIAASAKADFLQSAANPGLDLSRGSDPYRVALDWCAMLDTILRAAPRMGFPALTKSSQIGRAHV